MKDLQKINEPMTDRLILYKMVNDKSTENEQAIDRLKEYN